MNSWKKGKNSGAYYRNIKKKKGEIMRRAEEIRDEIRRNRIVRRRRIFVPPAVGNTRRGPQSIRNDSICPQPPPPLNSPAGVWRAYISSVL